MARFVEISLRNEDQIIINLDNVTWVRQTGRDKSRIHFAGGDDVIVPVEIAALYELLRDEDGRA